MSYCVLSQCVRSSTRAQMRMLNTGGRTVEVGMVKGCTRVCGKSQGFTGLPIRDEVLDIEGFGRQAQMVTAWFPSPKELEALMAGAPIEVRIWGTPNPITGLPVPQPMMLSTGDLPES